ncbi:FAD-binding protein [Aureimonas ureilytica]
MRLRRDPRLERSVHLLPSSGARPRYDLTQRSGRPRRDPRQEAASQAVRLAPRLRIDRTQHVFLSASAAQAAPIPESKPAVVRVEDAALRVLVITDPGKGPLTPMDRQLLASARIAAGAAGGVVLAVDREVDDAGSAGADRIVILPESAHPADRFETALALRTAIPLAHMMLPETPAGGDLGRRLAARFGWALFSGVEQIGARGLVRPVRGRKVDQEQAECPEILTLAPDMVPLRSDAPREGRIVSLDLPQAKRAVERVRPARGSLPLADSDFVVSAGNGIRDFELFRNVAAALGGTPGASRVVCDSGDMPRAAQVGASGTVLAADCYLALGIAGAPQHLQGIAGCRHVIAVNTDLHAAMVERAELAIVADAQPVMEALLRLAQEKQP